MHLTVSSCHVTYVFQSESTFYICLNVKVDQMVECSIKNEVVLGSSPVAVTSPSDFLPPLSKEFLDIQETTECVFTLKHVRDMTRTYSQMHRRDG